MIPDQERGQQMGQPVTTDLAVLVARFDGYQAEMSRRFDEQRDELRALRSEMNSRFVRADVHARDIAAVRAEISDVRGDIGEIKGGMSRRAASTRIVWSGLAAALLSAGAAVIAAVLGH